MFEDKAIREERAGNIPRVFAALHPHLQDNYPSSSVIRLTAEQRAKMSANDKRLGLVKALTHTKWHTEDFVSYSASRPQE